MDLETLKKLEAEATKGPWCVWDGVEYVGGGADLCIGAGEKWLANVDHRTTRCPQILDNGHFNAACDICTIDAPRITKEERANAALIVALRNHARELIAAAERAEKAERELDTIALGTGYGEKPEGRGCIRASPEVIVRAFKAAERERDESRERERRLREVLEHLAERGEFECITEPACGSCRKCDVTTLLAATPGSVADSGTEG